jgi:AcrR family transcriptional regulator
MNETRGRILDTAERLFALHGPAATSLRSIIGEAAVNLAAVHYHFRNKEALLDAIFERRVAAVNRERLAMLDEVERNAGDGIPPLEPILTAFIAPPLRMRSNPSFATFGKLMGRILAESNGEIIHKHFGEIILRFHRALHRALPQLAPEELQWRIYFCVAVFAHTMLGTKDMLGVPGEPTVERMVSFVAAGFRAPVAGPVTGVERSV